MPAEKMKQGEHPRRIRWPFGKKEPSPFQATMPLNTPDLKIVEARLDGVPVFFGVGQKVEGATKVAGEISATKMGGSGEYQSQQRYEWQYFFVPEKLTGFLPMDKAKVVMSEVVSQTSGSVSVPSEPIPLTTEISRGDAVISPLTGVSVRGHANISETATIVVTNPPDSAVPIASEKQALENWKRKMRDILTKLRSLDPKMHSQTVTGYLEKLRFVVNDLPYPTVIRWDDETRRLISDFVDYLDTLLPPKWIGYEERCFDYVNLLNMRKDRQIHELLKSRFLRFVSVLMNDSRFEMNPVPLSLYQSLNDYASPAMRDLVETALGIERVASGDAWSDERFTSMNQHIAFSGMRASNPEGWQTLVDFLFEEKKNADLHDPIRYKKASILLERAESAP